MRVVEEFVLILVDDANGALRPIPQDALKFAIAGAALIDLEMAGRIDTDLDSVGKLPTILATERSPTGQGRYTRAPTASWTRQSRDWFSTTFLMIRLNPAFWVSRAPSGVHCAM